MQKDMSKFEDKWRKEILKTRIEVANQIDDFLGSPARKKEWKEDYESTRKKVEKQKRELVKDLIGL